MADIDPDVEEENMSDQDQTPEVEEPAEKVAKKALRKRAPPKRFADAAGNKKKTSAKRSATNTASKPAKKSRPEPEEPKELTITLKKGKSAHRRLKLTLDNLQSAWNDHAEDPTEELKHKLTTGLDDANDVLNQIVHLHDQCLEFVELEEDDPRLRALEDDLFQCRTTYENLRAKVLSIMGPPRNEPHPGDRMYAGSEASAMTGPQQPFIMPVYYPHYDPKKDGITFSGTNSRDYAAFLIGWKTVEAEFEKRNKPKIELFRQLKKCLSNDPLELIKDIQETEDAVDAAFEILNEYYRNPLDGILATLKALSSGGKGSCNSSHASVWEVYKKYLAAERAKELFGLDSETEAAMLLIAQTHLNFTADMEARFKKYLIEYCQDPGSPLQYHIDRKTMSKFLQYVLKTTSKTEQHKKQDNREPGPSAGGNNRPFRKHSASATFSTVSGKACALCNKAGHSTQVCYELRKKDPGYLLTFSRKKRLCQACFEPFAAGHSCGVTCKRPDCGDRHMTRLHDVVRQHEADFKSGSRANSGGQSRQFSARSPMDAGQKQYTWRRPNPSAASSQENPQKQK